MDATTRNMKTALIEKKDFAGGRETTALQHNMLKLGAYLQLEIYTTHYVLQRTYIRLFLLRRIIFVFAGDLETSSRSTKLVHGGVRYLERVG